MNKKKTMIVASIAAGVIVIGSGIWYGVSHKGGNDADNVVYVNEVESLMNPGSGAGAMNRFAGVVETQEKLEIPQNQEKKVKEVFVEEGQQVQVGTPLFAYDTEQTEENLSKARLELERISNTIGNKANEIAALEKEKRNADSDSKLEYTMQIQSAQMEMKQSEYEKKSKQVEISKLEDEMENAQVESTMAGVVKSINNGSEAQNMYSGEEQSFMTIIAMGDFRIKGKVNEQNMGAIMPGQAVIVHSRVDETKTWKGTMGEVDMQNPGNDSNNYYFGDGNSMTQSNSYPFFVDLETSEGLMLGQHVYIELDFGQQEKKAGIWLDESFICDIEKDPYVWADNGSGKLEKRNVILGQHDEEMFQYEIADGLKEDDMITFPEEGLEKGMKTVKGANGRMGQSNPKLPEGEDMPEEMPMEDGAIMNEEEVPVMEDGEAVTEGMEETT